MSLIPLGRERSTHLLALPVLQSREFGEHRGQLEFWLGSHDEPVIVLGEYLDCIAQPISLLVGQLLVRELQEIPLRYPVDPCELDHLQASILELAVEGGSYNITDPHLHRRVASCLAFLDAV